MSEKKEKLIKLRKSLLEQLSSSLLWVDGSIVETTRIQSGKKKAFNYLSRSKEGKNQITYISAKHLDAFKEARASGKRVNYIIDKIIEINIKLLKMGESDLEK
jgi:hypothetical protein